MRSDNFWRYLRIVVQPAAAIAIVIGFVLFLFHMDELDTKRAASEATAIPSYRNFKEPESLDGVKGLEGCVRYQIERKTPYCNACRTLDIIRCPDSAAVSNQYGKGDSRFISTENHHEHQEKP
jgi:hypothetical protein